MLRELELHFAGADNVKIVQQHLASWLELHGAHLSVAIVSLTQDQRIDELKMMEDINTPAFTLALWGR